MTKRKRSKCLYLAVLCK